MMRAALRVLVTALALATITGCSSSDRHAGSPPSEPAFPPRPLSVSADRVAPCDMLAPDQAQRLGLRRPSPINVVVDGQPSSGCTWLGSTSGLNVQFIPIGADVAIAVPGATITTVNGFGAVRSVPAPSGSPPICQVAVDVAAGQTVRVQANALPSSSYGMDELCRRADEAASMVMTILVATAPR